MTCACGHEYDEHVDGAECDVEDCPCVHFDEDPDAAPTEEGTDWTCGKKGNERTESETP